MATESNAETYGVGVYGCGFIGRVHAYCHINLPLFYDPPPLNTRLVGVCTSRRETAEEARKKIGFAFGTDDPRELLESDEIDIVHCCAPNHLHRHFLIAAIEADKHIYCDKPLALNAEEAEEIRRVAERTGYSKKFQMTHQYRYLPATMRARQLIDEGFVGRVFGFRAQYLHSGYIDARRPMSWRLEAEKAGSGALGDLGTHALDLIYSLLGPYRAVFAHQETFIPERPNASGGTSKVNVDDVTVSTVRMQSGALGTVEAWRLATGAEDELRFEIHGSKGALRFNLMEPNWLEVFDADAPSSPMGGDRGWKRVAAVQRYPEPAGFPGPKFSIGWIRAHQHCLYAFLKAIAADHPTAPSLTDAVYIQHVHDAIAESAQGERWTTVNASPY